MTVVNVSQPEKVIVEGASNIAQVDINSSSDSLEFSTVELIINETDGSVTVTPGQPPVDSVVVEGTANYFPMGERIFTGATPPENPEEGQLYIKT